MIANHASTVTDIVTAFGADRGRLMDIAIAVQHHFGHIGDASVHTMATCLGIHPVEVEEMVSFRGF